LRWSQKPAAKNKAWLAELAKDDPSLKIKTLEEEPELLPHLNWVWEGFQELNYRRGISMSGPVPITMCDIEAYARYRAIFNPYERDRFLTYLRVLDQEWMNNHYEDQKKRQGDTDTSPKPSTNRPR
jgi:hypothetical protein